MHIIMLRNAKFTYFYRWLTAKRDFMHSGSVHGDVNVIYSTIYMAVFLWHSVSTKVVVESCHIYVTEEYLYTNK